MDVFKWGGGLVVGGFVVGFLEGVNIYLGFEISSSN